MAHALSFPVSQALSYASGNALLSGGGVSPSLPAQTLSIGAYPVDSNGATFNSPSRDTWLGAEFDNFIYFIVNSSWAGFRSDATNATPQNQGKPVQWAVALTQSGTTLAQVAAGSNDADFTFVAQALATKQPGIAVDIRLGFEFNLSASTWCSHLVETDFINAWRRVVGLFRAVDSRFRFHWCSYITLGANVFDPTTSYPGDAYVDYITGDSYYDISFDGSDPNVAFNFKKNDTWGYDALVAFAATHTKPWALSEWAVNSDVYAPVIPLMAAYFIANNVNHHNYWDSDAGKTPSPRLSNNQYPNSATAYIAAFGRPVITSSATIGVSGGVALNFPLVASHPSTWQIVGGADRAKCSISGNLLSMTAKDFANPGSAAGTNVYSVQIRAVDSRQKVSATQSIAITVTANVTDLYPTFDFAFDPIQSFYKVNGFATTSLAAFLARPEVSFASDPTVAISAAGYNVTDTYQLKVDMTASAAWSIYNEAITPTFSSGVYGTTSQLERATEGTTLIQLLRDGFANSPQRARSGVRNVGSTIGTDTNYFSLPAAAAFKVGITTSTVAIKYFAGGALGLTVTNNLMALKPMGRLGIGDGSGATAWGGIVKRVWAKYGTDSDATAQTATT